MESLVYQTEVDYQDVEGVLNKIRETIRDLRRTHPELNDCALADVGLMPKNNGIDVTLYFLPSD